MTKVVSVELSDEASAKLDRIARTTRRDRSDLLSELIRDYPERDGSSEPRRPSGGTGDLPPDIRDALLTALHETRDVEPTPMREWRDGKPLPE